MAKRNSAPRGASRPARSRHRSAGRVSTKKAARRARPRVSRPSLSLAEALERVEKILAKELRNRDGIDFANVNLLELETIRELIRDAQQYGGAAVLERAEAILTDMKDWDGRRWTQDETAFADVRTLRTVHGLVLDAQRPRLGRRVTS